MISAVVWLMVLLIMVPNMIIPIKDIKEKPNVGCMEFKNEFGRNWHLLTNFISIAIFFNFSAIILISNCLVIRQLYRNKDNENYPNGRELSASILGDYRLPHMFCSSITLSESHTPSARQRSYLTVPPGFHFSRQKRPHCSWLCPICVSIQSCTIISQKLSDWKITETFVSHKESKAQKKIKVWKQCITQDFFHAITSCLTRQLCTNSWEGGRKEPP